MSEWFDRWLGRKATNFQTVVTGKAFMAAHLVREHGMTVEEVAGRMRMTVEQVERVSAPGTVFSGWDK